MRQSIVFANQQQRQFPQRGHVHHFVKSSPRDGAITKKHHGNAAIFADLGIQGGTGCNGITRTDDSVRTEHARAEIGNMQRPALAFAIPIDSTKQLGHHAVHAGANRNAVAMPAVGRGGVIALCQSGTNAHGARLLTFVAVQCAIDISDGRLVQGGAFKGPNSHHVAPETNPLCGGQVKLAH